LRDRSDLELSVVSQYWEKPFIDSWNDFEVRREFFDRSLRPSFAPQRELIEAVARTQPDAVHLHYGPNLDYGGRLGEPLVGALRALRRQGIKIVLTLHSLWLPGDVLDSQPARRLPSPVRPLVRSYFGRLMRSLRSSCDEFACLVSSSNSPMTREFADAYGLHGISEEVHGCKPRFSDLPPGPPLIFSFGFLRPDKGFEYLIDGFAQYVARGGAGRLLILGRPQAEGDLPYARYLQEKALGVPAGRCTVEARFCSDEELESYLQASSLIVLPYLRNVGASGPLHHALGVGRPIITTDVGHNRALAGVATLVKPADASAIAEALVASLQDRRVAAEAAQRVRAQALDRSWSMLAARYESIYAGLRERTA